MLRMLLHHICIMLNLRYQVLECFPAKRPQFETRSLHLSAQELLQRTTASHHVAWMVGSHCGDSQSQTCGPKWTKIHQSFCPTTWAHGHIDTTAATSL